MSTTPLTDVCSPYFVPLFLPSAVPILFPLLSSPPSTLPPPFSLPSHPSPSPPLLPLTSPNFYLAQNLHSISSLLPRPPPSKQERLTLFEQFVFNDPWQIFFCSSFCKIILFSRALFPSFRPITLATLSIKATVITNSVSIAARIKLSCCTVTYQRRRRILYVWK